MALGAGCGCGPVVAGAAAGDQRGGRGQHGNGPKRGAQGDRPPGGGGRCAYFFVFLSQFRSPSIRGRPFGHVVLRRFVGARAGVHPRHATCTGQPRESHVRPHPPYRYRRRCRFRRSGDSVPGRRAGVRARLLLDRVRENRRRETRVTSARRSSSSTTSSSSPPPTPATTTRSSRRAPPRSRRATPPPQAAALKATPSTVLAYVADRFSVDVGGAACRPTQVGDVTIGEREGVPYADLLLDWTCPERVDEHEVRSGLFPDARGLRQGHQDDRHLRDRRPVGQRGARRRPPVLLHRAGLVRAVREFFRLGAEHLLTGIDHILFLLALIAGSRRLREIVLAATSFTLAHSVTFMLAALGLVEVPAAIVEPVIALSIAVVAGWHLWRIWRRGEHATDLETAGRGHFSLDRAGLDPARGGLLLRPRARARLRRRAGHRRGVVVDAAVVAAGVQRRHRGRSAGDHRCRLPAAGRCCAAVRRKPGSGRPGRSPRACP